MIDAILVLLVCAFAIYKSVSRSRWLACPHVNARVGHLGEDFEPSTDEDNRAQLNMLAREIRDEFNIHFRRDL